MVNPAYDLLNANIGLNEGEKKAALQDYLSTGGVNLDPATTAWCAAVVNATLAQTGQKGTGSNLARSFLNWGQEVREPQRGDLAVFWRGERDDGTTGHVGFFDGYNPDGSIRVLGGNQGDAVNVSSYGADRLLGFRRAGETGVAPSGGAGAGNALAGLQPSMNPEGAFPGQNALAEQWRPAENRLNPADFMMPVNQLSFRKFTTGRA